MLPLSGNEELQLGKSIAPACHVSAYEKHRLLFSVYRAAHNITLIGFLGFISNLTPHASHPPFSSLSPCMFQIAGVRIGLFTPGQAFETVAQTQINKLREPSTNLAELVSEQLNMIFRDAVLKVSWSQS